MAMGEKKNSGEWVKTDRKDKLGRPIYEKVVKAAQDLSDKSNDLTAVKDFGQDITSQSLTIDDFAEMYYDNDVPAGKRVDYEDLCDAHQEKIDSLQAELDNLVENGTDAQLLDFAYTLSHSQEYQDLVYTKEKGRKDRDALSEEFSKLNSELEKSINEGNFGSFTDGDKLYEIGQKAVQAQEDYKAVGMLLDDYKNLVSTAMFHSHEKRDTSDTVIEFEGSSLGDNGMTMVGDFEPGSMEWLEFRQTGFGGSDIGAIGSEFEKEFDAEGNLVTKDVYLKRKGSEGGRVFVGTDVDENGNPVFHYKQVAKRNRYYAAGLEKIWDSKVEPISQEQADEQTKGQTVFTDAASRGNAQEGIIGELAARKLGMKIMKNKGTWNNGKNHININYDYLLTSDGIHPDGNFEIKTASDPSKWGKEELGIDGVPNGYRAQAIAGCIEAGFDRGAIGVLINETDLRVYQFDINDQIRQEHEINKTRAEQAYTAAEEARQTGSKEFKPEYFGLASSNRSSSSKKGFPKAFLSKGMAGEKGRFFKRIAKFRGTTPEAVEVEFISQLPVNKKDWTEADIEKALVNVYRNPDHLKGKKIKGIDIEANSFSATKGRLFEVGVAEIDFDKGTMTNTHINQLYSMPRAMMDTIGTGAVDVHGVTKDDIKDKPLINDTSHHDEIVSTLKKDGGIIYAHNANYEKQFLRAHIKGFAQAEAQGDIYFMDSMDLAKKTMPHAEDSKMSSFTAHNGVSYQGAHRAYNDAEMMVTALRNYYSGMFGGEA